MAKQFLIRRRRPLKQAARLRFDSRAASRYAMVSVEVVMTIAVMLPIAAALLFIGVRMSASLYQAISTLVSWPFL